MTLFDRELPDLTPGETRRYGRHLVIPEVGPEGQRRLKAARVLIVGVGGLGSPVATYLAAAGVGHLGLVDFDTVDETNLQRQILYGTSDVGRLKIDVAAMRLREINPHVDLGLHRVRFGPENALELVEAYDVVVDGTDNFPARYLVNDACVLAGKPNVWGSIFRFDGQVSVFWAQRGPCYRCLFPEPPPVGTVPSCAEAGVLGVVPGIIGTLQANEVIKLIIGLGEPLVGRLVVLDALTMELREIALRKQPSCPICSDQPRIRELVEYGVPCEPPGGEIAASDVPFEITVAEASAWKVEERDFELVDIREPVEVSICSIEGSIHIPMRELAGRLGELDRERLVVVYCHHGARSAHVVRYLRSQGYHRTVNLGGGIDAWSREVDSGVARY